MEDSCAGGNSCHSRTEDVFSALADEHGVRRYLTAVDGGNLSDVDASQVMSSCDIVLRAGVKRCLSARRVGDAMLRRWPAEKVNAATRMAARDAHLHLCGGFDTYDEWFSALDRMREPGDQGPE